MSEQVHFQIDSNEQLSTFYVGDLLMGINVMSVQEVIPYQESTVVPLSGDEVSGLINLRGRIITAIDLRKLLKMEDRDSNSDTKIVVVHDDSEVVGIIVDDIGDVYKVNRDSRELAPSNLSKLCKKLIKYVYKLEGKLLLELKSEMLIY